MHLWDLFQFSSSFSSLISLLAMGSPLPGILSHRKLAVEWIRLLQASTLPPMKFSQHYPAKKALFNTYSHHQSGKIAMTFPRRYSTRSKLAHIGPVPYDACHTRLFSTIYAHNKTNRSTTLGQPAIHEIFESKTGTWQYLVADPSTLDAVIIDPVLDFDPATGAITTTSADMILQLISQNGYKVGMILETHIHADHITAASYLQNYLTNQQNHRPVLGIGKRIKELQELFGRRYKVLAEEYDSAFDKHFDDDETFQVGGLNAQAIHLPGHTPDHIGYRIGGMIWKKRLISTELQLSRAYHLPSRQRFLWRLFISCRHWNRPVRLPWRKCKKLVQFRAQTTGITRPCEIVDGPRLSPWWAYCSYAVHDCPGSQEVEQAFNGGFHRNCFRGPAPWARR